MFHMLSRCIKIKGIIKKQKIKLIMIVLAPNLLINSPISRQCVKITIKDKVKSQIKKAILVGDASN